jgi:serine/threonine protein kinase
MPDASAMLPVSAAARWSLIRRMAEHSGQSQVFEVRSQTGDAKGVLKVPNRVRVQAERLKREIAALREINHPSIAPVVDFDLDDERPWLVTPLGTPLPAWWKDHAGSEASTAHFDLAAHIIDSPLDALAEVHERGLIDRDIKPDNVIMPGAKGSPALIDFGLVYWSAGRKLDHLTA